MFLFISHSESRYGLVPLIRAAMALMILMGLGCSKGASPEAEVHSDEHSHEHDHEHEHDHDHHHVPDHKPENFSMLVKSLDERLHASDIDAHDWEEIIDLVRWIPELAADSDLRRKDFESALHISESLIAELQPQPKPGPTSKRVEGAIGALKDLATRSDLRPKVESGTSEAAPESGQG